MKFNADECKLLHRWGEKKIIKHKCNPSARHWIAVTKAGFKFRGFMHIFCLGSNLRSETEEKINVTWVLHSEQTSLLTTKSELQLALLKQEKGGRER